MNSVTTWSGFCFFIAHFVLVSCDEKEPKIVFRFQFDSTQTRLDNTGQPSVIPAGNRAQTPTFNSITAHYIELAPTAYTGLGTGSVVYQSAISTAGGDTAIDFSESTFATENSEFLSIPISSIPPGTYEWIRVSLAYQNYDIRYRINANPPSIPSNYDGTGTVASFIGYRSYISSFMVKTQMLAVNANKLQGFWAFESTIPGLGPQVRSGQAPPGATTVPNPIFATSPIPQGSCVVTGAFASPLTITGKEKEDILITLSVSVNKSFEWKEANGNDLYEPLDGDTVVDMGIRGLKPRFE
jgi:hypothetical protein